MRRLFLIAAFVAFASAANAQDAPLAPMNFLQGCWRGVFAGIADVTDVHCFAPMQDGRYVRDTHALHGGQHYGGETIYAFDPETHRIVYTYYDSTGGMSRGYVETAANGLRFPDDHYVGADGHVLNMRASWLRDGADRVVLVVEELHAGAWRENRRESFVRAPEISSPS